FSESRLAISKCIRAAQAPGPSSLVDANQGCLADGVLARLALDLTTGRRAAERQTIDREREQPKMIMMRPMAARWAWAAVAGPLKIIDGLLKPALFGIACSALGKRCQGRRDVIGCPVMPGVARCVRIIAEKDEAAGAGGRIAPAQGRGQVVTITGEASRDCCAISKRARGQTHTTPPKVLELRRRAA